MRKRTLVKHLKKYGVYKDEAFAETVIQTYERRYPEVVKLWFTLFNCVETAVTKGTIVNAYGIQFEKTTTHLVITLPSGSKKHYFQPEWLLKTCEGPTGPYNAEGLSYTQSNGLKKDVHKGLLTAHIIQHLARDVFADGMLKLTKKGFSIVLHSHDEIVCEESHDRLNEMIEVLAEMPEWLNAPPKQPIHIPVEGHTCLRYSK
jgi:DNA polymerase